MPISSFSVVVQPPYCDVKTRDYRLIFGEYGAYKYDNPVYKKRDAIFMHTNLLVNYVCGSDLYIKDGYYPAKAKLKLYIW